MIIPSTRLLWVGVVLLAAALGVSTWGFHAAWVALAAAAVPVALIDGVLGLRLPTPAVARRVPQRAIDWKATARTARLIAREYEEEKDQRLLLVIDCGRRMASKDDDLSHFDHTLNAALLLAHVALRQGDAVGMLTMGGVQRYLEPRKSVAAVHALLNSVYDIEPTLAVPDYDRAARDVMRRMRRRALVILLTNLRDEDDETLLPALKLLGTRHLVVLASLREAILGRALSARVDSFDRAVTHAAAAEYLAMRERVFRRIGAAGVMALDVEPERLPITLVNRYLELKREGRL